MQLYLQNFDWVADQLRSKVDQQGLLQHFQSRWRKEYLTSLREVHRTTGTTKQAVKIGDVVQIHDDTPRTQWKLGVIEELVKGNDFVRSVTVRIQQVGAPIIQSHISTS